MATRQWFRRDIPGPFGHGCFGLWNGPRPNCTGRGGSGTPFPTFRLIQIGLACGRHPILSRRPLFFPPVGKALRART